jgi:hypothetical protein
MMLYEFLGFRSGVDIWTLENKTTILSQNFMYQIPSDAHHMPEVIPHLNADFCGSYLSFASCMSFNHLFYVG